MSDATGWRWSAPEKYVVWKYKGRDIGTDEWINGYVWTPAIVRSNPGEVTHDDSRTTLESLGRLVGEFASEVNTLPAARHPQGFYPGVHLNEELPLLPEELSFLRSQLKNHPK